MVDRSNWFGTLLLLVIIIYSLAPNFIYRMAQDCAAATMWVYQSIGSYGCNPNRIFAMGHSAGAHLIALINADRRFFGKYGLASPIYGLILLDAFGLGMYQYLSEE